MTEGLVIGDRGLVTFVKNLQLASPIYRHFRSVASLLNWQFLDLSQG